MPENDNRHLRSFSPLDRVIIRADRFFAALLARPPALATPSPADRVSDVPLSHQQRRHVAGLMRVNHAGEVSAQALYQGQAMTSRNPLIQHDMQHAAREEADHLAWCRQRLQELDDRTSLLDPLWYFGSLSIGTLAGLAGDRWSLGFVAETERQVVRHLQDHLARLPENDQKSRAILQQMMADEARHGESAMAAGGVELPAVVKKAMQTCSRIMTRTAYRL